MLHTLESKSLLVVILAGLGARSGVQAFASKTLTNRRFNERPVSFPFSPALVPGKTFPTFYDVPKVALESSSKMSTEEGGDLPLAFVVGVFGGMAHLVFRFFLPKFKDFSRIWLAAFMLGGASMRLNKKQIDDMLIPMVPPPLPARFCVFASGIVEAICAILLLVPKFQVWGGKLTVLLLLGVYPSHFYHALSEKAQKEIKIEGSQTVLYVRIVLQLLFIYWASWFVPSKAAWFVVPKW